MPYSGIRTGPDTVRQKFKLYSYVWSKPDAPLLPLAGMIEGPSFTWTKKGQQAGDTKNFKANDNVQLDQLSGFYAGKILDKLGAFGQVTYDGVAEKTSWDNLDIRFANDATLGSTRVVYGITINNNPTVQDLWNSLPAWGFPYASSAVAPTPAASPLIANVGQQVLGVTAYTLWNEWLYTEAGAYRSLSNSTLNRLGTSNLDSLQIDSLAPYWRLALQHDWSGYSFSIGTYGLYARGNPGWDSSAGNDHYTDLGVDATYRYIGSKNHIFGLNTTYIHENQDASLVFVLRGRDLHLLSSSLAKKSMHEVTQTTVYIVDDNKAILESLGALFSSVGMKVGTFASAQAFLDFLDKQSAPCIGCLLVDVRMPGLSGLELQAQLTQRQPHLPIIVITGHGDIAMAVRAMKAGAKDFIEKPFNEQRLLEQVQACLAETWRTQQELDELQSTQVRLGKLTQRERSVLTLLMQGKPSKVIANDLGISPKTVDVYRSNIMDRVGVRSLVELIRRVAKLEKRNLH